MTAATQPFDAGSARRLSLAHMWIGFLLSGVAGVLGLYQLLERDGRVATSAAGYYQSVTLHGVVQAFVLTTFFIVGFGYFVTTTSLERPVRWPRLAWLGFWTMLVGSVVAALAIASGRATVLYTFYPPMIAHWSFYAGAALLLVGSLAWTAITIAMTVAWKRENPGRPLPLPQFGMTSCAILWAWTLVGVVLEVVFQLLPMALGMTQTIDVGLARALFAWTLHPIVYFWLIPAYVTLYSIVPKAAGGYLFSDEAGRIVFVMLLVFSLPIGLHHVFVDPEQAAGWKLMHTLGTFLVALPTLLTGFTVTASLETAGRLRGGKGLFGWIGRLPWGEPVALGGILAVFTLLPGGFGGLINASYAMDTMIHNTAWIPAHFHLILGGTVVTVYFASAYALWPRLTGRSLYSRRMATTQLWLWFVGIFTLTIPWHYQGLLWMPRRVAYAPYDPQIVARWRPLSTVMIVGGAVMVLSTVLFLVNLFLTHRNRAEPADRSMAYAETLEPVVRVPALLNGFAVWNWLLVALMAIAWAYPIGQFFFIGVHKSLGWGDPVRIRGAALASAAALVVATVAVSVPSSRVAWTLETVKFVRSGDPARGKQLHRDCAECHGPTGIIDTPEVPNLAGQDPLYTFKQLQDYKNELRSSPTVMVDASKPLSDRDMADLAAFYARQAPAPSPASPTTTNAGVARLVSLGDGARLIPACEACHGAGVAGAPGSYGMPDLTNQKREDLSLELTSFRSGERANDVYRVMRDVCRKLTDEEIAGLAAYYSKTAPGKAAAAPPPAASSEKK